MRYPGEWKFPGGVMESTDESLEITAIREFQEEFLAIKCPANIQDQISLFNRKYTLPVQGRQYEMNNFLIYDEDEVWSDEEIQRVNQNLILKKEKFLESKSTGEYWSLSHEEKSLLSPEVYQLQWFDLDEAIALMESAQHHSPKFVNDWQYEEFQRYGIQQRDPMYQSMMTLIEIRQAHSRSLRTTQGRNNE
jgi:8-oxo-dGTP pyrophosphatase MutT (NUDIX family)